MKNNYLIISIVGLFSLVSCGTTTRMQSENNRYQNGIYYTPSANDHIAYQNDQQELRNLQNKTQKSIYDSRTNTETIYLSGDNEVDINYNPNINYAIVDSDESYEQRLRKFDSPTYTININTNYSWGGNPWWGPNWGWNNYYWPYYGSRWWRYNNWWGNWYDPWWGPNWGWGPSWNNPWWGGCYDPWWGGHHHHPYPGPGISNRPRRDVYYGKREQSPLYNQGRPSGGNYNRNPSTNQVRGNSSNMQNQRPGYNNSGVSSNNSSMTGSINGNNSSNNNSGTVYRRGSSSSNSNNGYINSRPSSQNSNTSNTSSGQSQSTKYRRTETKANVSTGNNNSNSNKSNSNSYNRSSNNSNSNNSSYSRSSYGSGSSYSSGSGASRSSSGGATRSSSGGGSTYRR